jgi:hypothetical protein
VLVELAASSGKLLRLFVWGSFVTAKPAPKDLDILLIMGEDFEVEEMDERAGSVFDSVKARLMFEADVFWARDSIGEEMLKLWLDTYQISRDFGNAVLWSWSGHDRNRRSNVIGARVYAELAKNSFASTEGAFTARLHKNGGAHSARNPAA